MALWCSLATSISASRPSLCPQARRHVEGDPVRLRVLDGRGSPGFSDPATLPYRRIWAAESVHPTGGPGEAHGGLEVSHHDGVVVAVVWGADDAEAKA